MSTTQKYGARRSRPKKSPQTELQAVFLPETLDNWRNLLVELKEQFTAPGNVILVVINSNTHVCQIGNGNAINSRNVKTNVSLWHPKS